MIYMYVNAKCTANKLKLSLIVILLVLDAVLELVESYCFLDGKFLVWKKPVLVEF